MTIPHNSTQADDGEAFLDRETLDCLGLRRKADDPLDELFPDRRALEAFAKTPSAFAKPPTPKPPKSRRKLDRLIAQAEKATGKIVSSITTADGTTLNFGEPEPTAPTNPWLADLEKRRR
jgi:hypothetical protein